MCKVGQVVAETDVLHVCERVLDNGALDVHGECCQLFVQCTQAVEKAAIPAKLHKHLATDELSGEGVDDTLKLLLNNLLLPGAKLVPILEHRQGLLATSLRVIGHDRCWTRCVCPQSRRVCTESA